MQERVHQWLLQLHGLADILRDSILARKFPEHVSGYEFVIQFTRGETDQLPDCGCVGNAAPQVKWHYHLHVCYSQTVFIV